MPFHDRDVIERPAAEGGRATGRCSPSDRKSAPWLAAWLVVARPGRYTRAVGLHAALHERHRRPAPGGCPAPAERLRRAARSRGVPVARRWLLGVAMRWAALVGTPTDGTDRAVRRALAAPLLAPVLLLAVVLVVLVLGTLATAGALIWLLLLLGGTVRAAVCPRR